MPHQETSKHRIYKQLRREVIIGHRRPGERFNVEEEAERFQTSVTPVRDALQMLSQEDLVTIKPRSGYFVTQLTLKQLRDLLDLRKILEIAVIERAVHRLTDEQIETLSRVHAGYTGDDDAAYDRYTDENRRFHYLLAQATGNQELADILGHLHDRLARFMVMRRAGKSQEASHARILDALRRRDLIAARQAMVDEIEASAQAILDTIIQQERPA